MTSEKGAIERAREKREGGGGGGGGGTDNFIEVGLLKVDPTVSIIVASLFAARRASAIDAAPVVAKHTHTHTHTHYNSIHCT